MAGNTITRTVTLNPAFLQEIKEVNEELWQLLAELRHRCQRPSGPGPCRRLIDQLELLRDQLAMHFALEEAFGYFDDPAFVPVRIGDSAEKLRQEHRALYVRIVKLAERADRLFQTIKHEVLALWLATEFEKFDRALTDHESRENELIMDAYEIDPDDEAE
jgi:hypothetical protein